MTGHLLCDVPRSTFVSPVGSGLRLGRARSQNLKVGRLDTLDVNTTLASSFVWVCEGKHPLLPLPPPDVVPVSVPRRLTIWGCSVCSPTKVGGSKTQV